MWTFIGIFLTVLTCVIIAIWVFFRTMSSGDLIIVKTEETEAPSIFLELSQNVEDLCKKDTVTLRVKIIKNVPRK